MAWKAILRTKINKGQWSEAITCTTWDHGRRTSTKLGLWGEEAFPSDGIAIGWDEERPGEAPPLPEEETPMETDFHLTSEEETIAVEAAARKLSGQEKESTEATPPSPELAIPIDDDCPTPEEETLVDDAMNRDPSGQEEEADERVSSLAGTFNLHQRRFPPLRRRKKP